MLSKKCSVAVVFDPYRSTRHGVKGAATAQMEVMRSGEMLSILVVTRSMNETL